MWKHRIMILCGVVTLIGTAVVPVIAPITGVLAAKILAGAAIAVTLASSVSKAIGPETPATNSPPPTPPTS